MLAAAKAEHYTTQEEEQKVKKLTKYEKEQVDAIEKWKKEEPGVVSRAVGFVIEPLAWLVNKVVPEKAVRGALDFSNAMAKWFTDTSDVVRDSCVSSLGELRNKNLKVSDKLADEVHNWAIGLAVVEGAGTGIFGLPRGSSRRSRDHYSRPADDSQDRRLLRLRMLL